MKTPNFKLLHEVLNDIPDDSAITSILIEGEYRENIISKSWLPIFLKLKYIKTNTKQGQSYRNVFQLLLPLVNTGKLEYNKNEVLYLETTLKYFLSDINVLYVRLLFKSKNTSNIETNVEAGNVVFK